MTHLEAIDEINAAFERLKAVRDALGKELSDKTCNSGETRRITDLHDGLAMAISAYRTGK
jgi:hypothetical protein